MPRRTPAPNQHGWPPHRRERRQEPATPTSTARPSGLVPPPSAITTNAAGKAGP
jgi:hypothetical protein